MATDTAPDAVLVGTLFECEAQVGAAEARRLELIAEFDKRAIWKGTGAKNTAQWLSGALGISNWKARRWIAAAHALPRLPHIAKALGAGELCLDKVVELTRFAAPDDEEKLIAWAQRVTAATVRERADRQNCPAKEDVAEIEQQRYLRWWWGNDSRTALCLEGLLPAEAGEVVTKALRRVADRLPDAARSDLPEGSTPDAGSRLETRCADALVALAGGAIAADPDHATVVVHMPVDTLTRGAPGAQIEGGPAIHPHTAARLACDPRLSFVLTDAAGNALGIGDSSRNIPGWLERQVRYRDRTCTYPGCEESRLVYCHHIVPFPKGPTDLDNLILVCRFHHVLLHEGGWDALLTPDGLVQWFRPDGTPYRPGPASPAPLLPD